MLKKLFSVLALMPLIGFACHNAQVEFRKAYVRAMAPGQANAAVYMDLANTGDQSITIDKVSTPAAKHAEIHQMKDENGVARMESVKQLTLPAHSTTELQPGGLHVMLMKVEKPLQPGDSIDLTFQYSDGSRHTVQNIEVK